MLIAFGIAISASASSIPVITVGTSYTDTHIRMISAGFRTFRIIPPNTDAYRMNFAYREEVPEKYPEAVECAPTEQSPCNFLFERDSDQFVEITTVGEHVDTMTVSSVRTLTMKEANDLYADK